MSIKDYMNKYSKFIKFVCVGASNTIVSLAIYYILKGIGVNYLVANIIGYIISSITGYMLNKLWVFKYKEEKKKPVFKYYTLYLSALLLNILLMKFQVSVLKISDNIAPLFTIVITTMYNYFFSKNWVFKSQK